MPNKETHRAFNQLLNTFLEINNKEKELAQDGTSGIKLVPIFLYNDTDKKLKVEFKIGNEQLTKINNLPDFFERMLNREKYKYNNVLEFIHEENAFEEQSRPLLKFLLKYAEIIKYANDVNNNYAYYGRNFNVNNVVLSNTGLDELFEILKGKTVEFETKTGERKIQFIDEPIDIKFILEKSDESTYCLTPNIDVYGYDIFYGKNYSYFLIDNKMHKCLPKVENRNLELLEVYKKNYTQSIIFNENNLRNFFAIVVPKIKDNFEIKNIDKEQIEKYMFYYPLFSIHYDNPFLLNSLLQNLLLILQLFFLVTNNLLLFLFVLYTTYSNNIVFFLLYCFDLLIAFLYCIFPFHQALLVCLILLICRL